MKKLNRLLLCLLIAAFGFVAGWCYGYMRPAIEAYRLMREATGLDNAGLREMYSDIPKVMKKIKKDNMWAAAIAANALSAMSSNNMERANQWLSLAIAPVYVNDLESKRDTELDPSEREFRERIEHLIKTNAILRTQIEHFRAKTEPNTQKEQAEQSAAPLPRAPQTGHSEGAH